MLSSAILKTSILLPQQFRLFFHWNTCPRCHLLPIASSFSPCPRVKRSVRGTMASTHLVKPQLPTRCHNRNLPHGTWKCPERRGDSRPLNIRDSSRWTFGGVYVMLIADLMLIASFATKVHPTTSRLLPNKLLWQHLGLPETIANGYPFHAEGCEKLLRRWTTVPSKNLQHLGSNMKCSFWFVLTWSFAVNRILKLDYLQSSKHLNMLTCCRFEASLQTQGTTNYNHVH